MPDGFGEAPWDELLTDADVERLFQQVAVVNRARHHTMVVTNHRCGAGQFVAFMARKGYSDMYPILASKPPPNLTGMNLTFAVEMLLVGYKGGIGNCLMTFRTLCFFLQRHHVQPHASQPDDLTPRAGTTDQHG